jgi:hypothetical protein
VWKSSLVLSHDRYSLTVRVTDHGGAFSTNVVTLVVSNVNDVTISGFEGAVQMSTLGNQYVRTSRRIQARIVEWGNGVSPGCTMVLKLHHTV